ncbi:hypothetical protein GCM10027059_14480 [Myceligenerans halotolerans]
MVGDGDPRTCEPQGDVAVGTYTTPPDPEKLWDITAEMIIGPDGEPLYDS